MLQLGKIFLRVILIEKTQKNLILFCYDQQKNKNQFAVKRLFN